MTTTDAPAIKSDAERVTTAGGDGGNTDYAGKHKSFPIASPGDVRKAAQAIGRAGDDNYSTDALKRRIIAIATRRGADYIAQLPDAWKPKANEAAVGQVVDDAPGTDDEPLADDDSLEARIEAVRKALITRCCPMAAADGVAPPGTYPYIVRTWEDRVLYSLDDTLYLLDYTMDGDDCCVLGATPVEAETLYAPEPPDDMAEAQAAPPTRRRTLALTEAVLVEAADPPSGVLHVTLLKAGWSTNGRYYSPQVVEQSAPLFEGVRAFGDHPTKGERPERSIWDQVGFYRHIDYDAAAERLTGELKLVGSEDRKAHILAWATESIGAGQPLMGLSINAVGETREGEAQGRQGVLVDRLIAADSVDIVTRPAAGGAFTRLAATEGDSLTRHLLAALSFDEWCECRPDFVRQLCEQQQAAHASDQLVAATRQLAEARAAATAAQESAAAQRQALDAELTAARATLADQAARLAEVDRAARLAALLEQVHLPFAHRPRLTKKLALIPELQWPAFLEQELEDLTAAVRRQPILGSLPAGPFVDTHRPAGADYALPIAEDGLTYRQWEAAKAARQRSN